MFLFLPVLPLPLSLFLPLPKGPEELEPGQPHSLLPPKLVCAFVRGSGPGQRSQALGLRGGPRPQEQRSLASFLPGVCGPLEPSSRSPLHPRSSKCQVPPHVCHCTCPTLTPLLPGSGGAMLASTNSGSSWPGKCWPPAPLVPHLAAQRGGEGSAPFSRLPTRAPGLLLPPVLPSLLQVGWAAGLGGGASRPNQAL